MNRILSLKTAQNIALVILLFACGHSAFAQTRNTDKEKINHIVNLFMQSLAEKDSVKFYNLFYSGEVSWVGRFSEKSHAFNKTKKADIPNFFISNYKEFFRGIYTVKTVEEKFKNVEIIEDGNIASVTFDYSFWMNEQKQNWGKEFWGLVKINDDWKITSVIFSMEYERINPEPKQ